MTWEPSLVTIHRILIKKNWSIATAESLTAGLISAALASQSGSSAYLRGGIVAYTIDAKVQLLRVVREVAEECNCVSNAVAVQMAWGIKTQFASHCGIAVTGYAEPFNGQDPHAHYAVFCGAALSTGVISGAGLTRNEMREEVVRYTLCEMAMMLEATDAG